MFPTLAISAANLGQNLLQSVTNQPNRKEEPTAVDFQKFLSKAATSPEAQKVSFLASEGIHDRTDAEEKLADLGAQVLQDPKVQTLLAGDSSPVEMRFLPDGAVSIKTSDGRQKTIHLEGETGEAAGKAATLVGYLQMSSPKGICAKAFSPPPNGTFEAPGMKIMPGAGTVTLLS